MGRGAMTTVSLVLAAIATAIGAQCQPPTLPPLTPHLATEATDQSPVTDGGSGTAQGTVPEVGSQIPAPGTDDWYVANTGTMPPTYVAACESHGDYQADNGHGNTGRWQFSDSTYASVGGSGRAMDSSPAEQDYRASLLWAGGSGAHNWDECL